MRPVIALTAALGACTGVIVTPPVAPPPERVPTLEAPTTAIPRVSRRELDAHLEAIFGTAGAASAHLPADPASAVNPATLAEEEVFDTLAAGKEPNQVFVEGLETVALEVARAWSARTADVAALAGCSPQGSGVDTTCLAQLVDRCGLRLWRRPVTPEERDALVQAVAAAAPTHTDAVQGVVMALINSPETVYRAELGTPSEPGRVRLTDRELVSRLAAFLWGASPPAALLEQAAAQPLDDALLGSLVDSMLDDPRAAAQQRTFHELWLRYTGLLVTDPALATDMRAETEALVARSLASQWTQLFTAAETFVTPALATHYGLAAPPAAAWVATQSPRAGILSHGSFLSLSATRVDDTLPSRRGAHLARRVLCQTVLPPPKDVNIDNGVEVPAGACKPDAYTAHRRGSCAGCHAVIDGLGFGFERLDGQGRYRESEPGRASCAIDGAGTFRGEPFSGPRELVDRHLPAITRCAVTQLGRFALRDRAVAPEVVDRFHEAFEASGHDFRALMRAVALDARFRVRWAEEGQP